MADPNRIVTTTGTCFVELRAYARYLLCLASRPSKLYHLILFFDEALPRRSRQLASIQTMRSLWFGQKTSSTPIYYAGVAICLVLILTTAFRFRFIIDAELRSHGALNAESSRNPVTYKSLSTIQNSTLGFGKVFAINLPERTDHHDGLVLASSVSKLRIDFVAGVHGDAVLDKVLPAKHAEGLTPATKGSWRAHINAISQVFEQNLESALIIEDDIDWDIRLKDQLQDLALSTCHILSTSRNAGTTQLSDVTINSKSSSSPYGQGWDVLWLGHCGMDLPPDANATMVLHENDETVPQIQRQRSWDVNAVSPLHAYPQHSRMVAEQQQGTCSLAYAVSRRGAQKILFALGLRRLDMAFDMMLREWCQQDDGNARPKCLGVHPQLFDHHRRTGPNEIDSDILAPNGQYRNHAYTPNIRWSVRMNMRKLLSNDDQYDDQWPDIR